MKIIISDIVFEEDYEMVAIGLNRFIQSNEPRSIFEKNTFGFNDSFSKRRQKNVNLESSSFLGNFEFKEKNKLSKYVKIVRVNQKQISRGYTTLYFVIEMNEKFLDEYNKILKESLEEEKNMNLKCGWSKKEKKFYIYGSEQNHNIIKNKILNDFVGSVKWKFMSEINSIIPLFLHEKKFENPSIEILSFRKEKEDITEDNFSQQLGLSKRIKPFYDISENGALEVNFDINEEAVNSMSFKIHENTLINELDKEEKFRHAFRLEELYNNSIPIITTYYAVKSFGIDLHEYSKLIRRKKVKMKKILKLSDRFEKNTEEHSRIQRSVSTSDFKKITQISKEYSEIMRPLNTEYTWLEILVGEIKFIAKENEIRRNELNDYLKRKINLSTIKSNNCLQKTAIWIAVLALLYGVGKDVVVKFDFFKNEEKLEMKTNKSAN